MKQKHLNTVFTNNNISDIRLIPQCCQLKMLPNHGARVSSSPISGQPIEITLTGIGLVNRGANFLPAAAGSKVAQSRGLAAVFVTLLLIMSHKRISPQPFILHQVEIL